MFKPENEMLNPPDYCCIALLESCFFKCKMCYKWQEGVEVRKPDEPTMAQWKQFVADLADMCEHKPQLNFAGGEPLARQETLELMEHAGRLGFDTLLATNGYLIDEKKAKDIGRAKVHCVSVSLDSIDPAIHNYLRGNEQSYARVINAIRLLREHAPDTMIDICTVISAVNLDGIIGLVKWVDENPDVDGVGFQAVTQPFSTAIDDKWYENPEYSFLWPKDISKVDKVMDEMIRLQSSGELKKKFPIKTSPLQFKVYKKYFQDPQGFLKKDHCHISDRTINITPVGQVHICFYKPPIGNIKDTGIKQIWESDLAKSVRAMIKTCNRNCQSLVNCNFEDSEEYID